MIEEYKLNSDQEAAAKGFFQFLFSADKEFIISGMAGVGKTYLMRYIIDKTMPQYREMCATLGVQPDYDDLVMTATTNKAAEVLAKSTGRPAQTIHSFMNLIVTDTDDGRRTTKRGRNWVVKSKYIIFIDECSMIDSNLYALIQEGTIQCKLVYVGDKDQLAPVMERLSKIYQQSAPMFELKIPMRNSGQKALMDICQQLRETVQTGIFKPIVAVPGVIDRLDEQGVYDQIDAHFIQQNLDCRILVYSNKRVQEYNRYVRDLRGLPPHFMNGEYLVNNSGINLQKKMLSAEALVKVELNHGTKAVHIVDDVDLSCDILDFTCNGQYFSQIPVPNDADHYDRLVKWAGKRGSVTKDWDIFKMLKNDFPDLRPRDAATVYKAQGSTYDSVFIDIENIGKSTDDDQIARMLYVAFSRARNRVFIYGELPARLQS